MLKKNLKKTRSSYHGNCDKIIWYSLHLSACTTYPRQNWDYFGLVWFCHLPISYSGFFHNPQSDFPEIFLCPNIICHNVISVGSSLSLQKKKKSCPVPLCSQFISTAIIELHSVPRALPQLEFHINGIIYSLLCLAFFT